MILYSLPLVVILTKGIQMAFETKKVIYPRQKVLSDFLAWLDQTKNLSLKKMWDSLSLDAKAICHTAIMELKSFTSYGYIIWWSTHHMRFFNVSGTEQRTATAIMQRWLESYSYVVARRSRKGSQETQALQASQAQAQSKTAKEAKVWKAAT
jgi:hypothetical protein